MDTLLLCKDDVALTEKLECIQMLFALSDSSYGCVYTFFVL